MRIITTLETLLNEQAAAGLIKGHRYTWGAKADNILGTLTPQSFPFAVLLTPQAWRLECDTQTAREVGTFSVFYLVPQTELDFDAVSNEALIDGCIDCAVDMVARCQRSHAVHVENVEVAGESLYDANNKNLTGCRLNITLKENQGRCLKIAPPLP